MRWAIALFAALSLLSSCAHRQTPEEVLKDADCDNPLVTCRVIVDKPVRTYPRTVQQAHKAREVRDFLRYNRARRQSEREHRARRDHHNKH